MKTVVSAEAYFNWLLDKIGNRSQIYSRLLEHLFYTEFFYILPMDENQIEHGLNLRLNFMDECNCQFDDSYANAPCSVLEIMVSLAIRCEIQIMGDSDYGNRTDIWFWEMIDSLGLSGMANNFYDSAYVDDVIGDFIDRNYEPNGQGGLFTVNDPPRDMRTVDIWYQMMFYLNEYIKKQMKGD